MALLRAKQDAIGPRRTTSEIVPVAVKMIFIRCWKSNRCFGICLQDVCMFFQFILLIRSCSIIQITEEKDPIVFVDLLLMLLAGWSELRLLMNTSVVFVTTNECSRIFSRCSMTIEKTQGSIVDFEAGIDSTFVPVQIQKTLNEKSTGHGEWNKHEQNSQWEFYRFQWTSIDERVKSECRWGWGCHNGSVPQRLSCLNGLNHQRIN